MYMIQNIIKSMHTDFGQVVISIILGIGLASISRRSCHDKECYKFNAETRNCQQNNKVTFA